MPNAPSRARIPVQLLLCILWAMIGITWAHAKGTASAASTVSASNSTDSEPRIALVIGNNDYRYTATLTNAVADARALKQELEARHFQVVYRENADRRAMNDAIEEFLGRLSTQAIGVIYYSGHGVQISGANYLIPVDLQARKESDVVNDAIELSHLLERVSQTQSKFTLAIVDACRNNPFQGTGKGIGGKGLAPSSSANAQGVMVVYAAGANQQALDRLSNADPDPNGLFTRELIKVMRKPGLSVQETVNEVKQTVIAKAQAVGYVQTPAIYDQSVGTFVFSEGVREQSAEEIEQEAWNNIKDSRDEKDFEDYLNAYPNGKHALLARQKKKNLTVVAAPVAAPVAIAAAPTAPPAPSGNIKDCSNCPEMVVIPSGSFMMGSPASEAGRQDNEGPQHSVSVRSYALGKTHVTRGQYAAFVTDSGYQAGTNCYTWDGTNFQDTPDRTWKNPGFAQREDEPVVCVSWEDTQAYVKWLSGKTGQTYRLPSEAEWEYACRAGQQQLYCGSNDVDSVAWYSGNSRDTTHPVGQKQANAWGLVDMSGNAFEWTQDCYHDSYSGAPSDGSAWLSESCDRRVLRGGSWFNTPQGVRSAFRFGSYPGYRVSGSGFRVARTLN